MDMSLVGPLRGRKVAPLPHYLSKRLNKKQKKVLKENGGLGGHTDRVGGRKKMVNITSTDQGPKVAVYDETLKHSRKNLTSHQKEYQDMMVRIMERESSGHHKRVKPSAAKRAKRRLKDYVDHGCPVQGVDV